MEKITKKMKRILFCLPFYIPFIIVYLWIWFRKQEATSLEMLENFEYIAESLKNEIFIILSDILNYRIDYVLSILTYLIIFL